MCCFSSDNLIDKYRTFSMQFTYEGAEEEVCAPKYQFNCLERMGNAMITPYSGELLAYEEGFDEDTCRGIMSYPLSFFYAIIAAVGICFKKVGEWMNSHSSERKQALALYMQIEDADETSASSLRSRYNAIVSAIQTTHTNNTNNDIADAKAEKKEVLSNTTYSTAQ